MEEKVLSLNILPDFVLRFFIRRYLSQRIQQITFKSENDKLKDFERLVKQMSDETTPIAFETVRANEQHYEVPTELFQVTLGPLMKYSCCYWPDEIHTLAQAERASLELYIERAQCFQIEEDGGRYLDLGCGWGAWTLFAAQKYPKCHFVAVSNSTTQRQYIEKKVNESNLKNVTVKTSDVNTLEFGENEFDRIISIEMFEHMRNYKKLFEKIGKWLKPNGLLFIQIFANSRHPYTFDNDGSWMTKNFFQGGTMPSIDLLSNFCHYGHLSLDQSWILNGQHYSKTLEAWLDNLTRVAYDKSSEVNVMNVLSQFYGNGNETKWLVNWRLFYLACSESFSYNNGEEWIVVHYRFKKNE
ncbi:unnamed protein product [Didymodactylos carnosus]|uniref:Uncharacterized protein n=1 Tax=Didymodactylos carnosus TaxID=1234261 RepID=A0A814TZ20_9BILA|nr:unnamed protein product [Didymodactylos carnosus]CAF1169120.1 unnamed protein product [Didymodactylos carnosus]CAF3632672.1 unnamed protein product [Didymodactylos carnosus]CAF3932849.1 unnamed protein product [Didymodactylos carnosus]